MFHSARAAGGDQRDVAHRANLRQLLQVVAVAYPVLVHHIENNLTRAALLHFLHPVEGFPLRHPGAALVAGILVDVILAGLCIKPGINPHHDTLHAKAVGKAGDQRRVGESRGVNRDLIGAEGEDLRRVFQRLDPARHAERNIDYFRHARHPALVDHPTVAGGGDIIEHQFVGPFVGIALGQRDDVANDLVITELHAFHYLAVADVEAGDYPFCQH